MPYRDTANDDRTNNAAVVFHSDLSLIILDTSTKESVNTKYIANTAILDFGVMLKRALKNEKIKNASITTANEDGLY